MKKIITIFAVLALVAGTSFAGSNVNESTIKQAVKGYKYALDSENAGVRNSALHQIAVLKTRVPDMETKTYKKMLDRVINDANEEAYIRVNAKMTKVILNDEVQVETLNKDTKDPNEFFNGIYSQLTDMYAVR